MLDPWQVLAVFVTAAGSVLAAGLAAILRMRRNGNGHQQSHDATLAAILSLTEAVKSMNEAIHEHHERVRERLHTAASSLQAIAAHDALQDRILDQCLRAGERTLDKLDELRRRP